MPFMRSALVLAIIACSSTLLAQTGPGGVGTSANNVLWLDAGYGVFMTGPSATADIVRATATMRTCP